jgi:sugar lactone lactonase YvrE/enterochelin esterase-like enzyme
MKPAGLIFFVMMLLMTAGRAQDIPGLSYPADPAKQSHQDIPKGEILKFDFNASAIFPGTTRTYWVYVPAQYNPTKPACLFVDMDGIQFSAPTVFDYLINKGEMPVTIGVFIGSGAIMKDEKQAIRFNRSHEFDSMNNDFVNFLLNELLPDVEKKKTSDGRAIRISRDANDHAIAGASSGAICAFTAAWERPDAFSRVLSAIGTYVSMRGGDQYPGLIRKTEPKPIRIFLQDGYNDAWNPLFGNWYTANLAMEAALSFSGYEVAHAWGNGGHDGKQADAIFPDVMRWLWKGWPERVGNGKSYNNMLPAILVEGETWQPVNDLKNAVSITANPAGEVLVQDNSGWINKIDINANTRRLIKTDISSMACAANGTLNVLGQKELSAISETGKKSTIQKNISGKKFVVMQNGDMYLTRPSVNENDPGKLLLVTPSGKVTVVDEGLRFASAITVSPDRGQLFVAEDNTNWIYSYVIQPDGSLKYKERWYWLHQTDDGGYSKVGDMAMDNAGNLYAATNLGVQVCDQNGRVRAILQTDHGPVTGLCFAGQDFNTLYVICGGKLYKRKLKTNGVPSWSAPVYPKSIGAG